jgi:hypothetical protein
MGGQPDYEKGRRLTPEELGQLSNEDILYSYLVIQADFIFPEGTKYPSIPCYVDENCTVYPLRGSCVLTGSEYLLAKSQKCKFHLHDIIYTPFKRLEDSTEIKPFRQILQQVQEQRREYPKGSISNLMYKEIGTSIYGSVVRGRSNKRKFDIKTKAYKR